jgi:hypothetical protein
MPQTNETRGAARRSRAPVLSAVAADTGDTTENLLALQSARLCRRFGLAPAVAQTVALHAFSTREGTR